MAKNENEPFVDKYGYQFNYKIVDATYKVIGAEELSENITLWQKIAESDVITEIYRMYDYVNFLCKWNTYFVNTYTNSKGETVIGYYLYASDAERYIYTDGAQWNYGYKEGYFDSIIAKIKEIDPVAFNDLIDNVEKAKALAEWALTELSEGNYTYEVKYVEKFGKTDKIYTITNGAALIREMDEIYSDFSNWLAAWEL